MKTDFALFQKLKDFYAQPLDGQWPLRPKWAPDLDNPPKHVYFYGFNGSLQKRKDYTIPTIHLRRICADSEIKKASIIMKQIKIIDLVWLLVKILFIHGNAPVFYHAIGGAKDCPMEVEEIEIRKTMFGNKVTIY